MAEDQNWTATDLFTKHHCSGDMPRTGLGVNPLVLNFRGNALSQLGRFREALQDYREATEIFRKAEIFKCFSSG